MLEFKDIRDCDTLRRDGELWTVIYVSPDKIVIQRSVEVFDLTGWEKVNPYLLTGKRDEK